MCREGSADKFSAALAFQMYMGVFMRKKYKIAVGLLGAVVFLLAILGGSLYVLKANVINHKPAMERGRRWASTYSGRTSGGDSVRHVHHRENRTDGDGRCSGEGV